MQKIKPRPVVRDDGVIELLRPEDEYQRGYQRALELIQDEAYVQCLVRRLQGEFFGVICDRSRDDRS
jgi:hypothetical protein